MEQWRLLWLCRRRGFCLWHLPMNDSIGMIVYCKTLPEIFFLLFWYFCTKKWTLVLQTVRNKAAVPFCLNTMTKGDYLAKNFKHAYIFVETSAKGQLLRMVRVVSRAFHTKIALAKTFCFRENGNISFASYITPLSPALVFCVVNSGNVCCVVYDTVNCDVSIAPCASCWLFNKRQSGLDLEEVVCGSVVCLGMGSLGYLLAWCIKFYLTYIRILLHLSVNAE